MVCRSRGERVLAVRRHYSSKKAPAPTGGFLTPKRLWLGIFAVWLLFISGILQTYTGSPGVLQAFRLYQLHQNKIAQLAEMELKIAELEKEEKKLQTDRAYIEQEIRRVLGYVHSDEIVFQF